MPTDRPPLTLVRITAPHFVAGLIYDPETDRVTMAAPILRYMMGWSRDMVADYCKSKDWTATTRPTNYREPLQ